MKINLVTPSFYPATIYGGPIFSTLDTTRELAALNHTILVSTTNANRSSRLTVEKNIKMEFEKNIFIKYYNDTFLNRLSIPLALNLWKDIRKSDVVNTQYIFSSPTPLSLFYSWLLNKPLLLSPRGSLAPWILANGLGFKKQWLSFLIKPFAKKIWWHATSEQEKQEILNLFPEAKVFIIPNGINLQESKSYETLTKSEFIKKYTGQSKDPSHVIISLGRLQKKKGFDILINAFNLVKDEYPSSCLLIAGQDEGEKENLNKQIAALGLKEKVFLLDQINGKDKWTFLHNADVFVLPSHNENFGNVYAEALAAGTPIIASIETPWKEVIKNNCGEWVKNTPEETALAINRVLGSDYKIMGKNGMDYIKKFEWKNIALLFEKVFIEMLNENK
jgi:glycosyltransferase involved in cell wall biosynthesis